MIRLKMHAEDADQVVHHMELYARSNALPSAHNNKAL